MGKTVKLSLEVSEAINDTIERIASESGCTKSDVLRKAVALMKVSHEARRRGLKVGTARPEQDLVQEFIGI